MNPDEETKLVPEEEQVPARNNNSSEQPVNSSEQPVTPTGGAGKRVASVGAGVVAGVAGAIAVERIIPYFEAAEVDTTDHATTTTTTVPQTPSESVGTVWTTTEDISVATVTDDMSFGEAFAAARSQVGAGGMFEWRGKVYGTYYADEWNRMTPEERAEWGQQADVAEVLNHSTDATSHTAPDVPPHATAHAAPEANNAPEVEVVVEVDQASAQPDLATDGTPIVEVIGVEAVMIDGTEMTAVTVEVNGEYAVLVDVDQDNIIDFAIRDINGDGTIAENEIADVSDSGIVIDDGTGNMGYTAMDSGMDMDMDMGMNMLYV
ncbi:MAG: hypothetical protein LBN06_07980 [Prevotellaceae bacterium]|nr:hypothetical protein [Prevotellaceae bacterium]